MKSKQALPDKQKSGLVIVYTGDGKGKTSAGMGLIIRGLGIGWKVAFIQFIKNWQVSEDVFFERIKAVYGEKLYCIKGGEGFYDVGAISARGVSELDHQVSAQATLKLALDCVSSGDYGVVVCDEVNNAVHDGLISLGDLQQLLDARHKNTSLCLTGRDFPSQMIGQVDIMTEMTKVKHHFDDGYIANRGIDF